MERALLFAADDYELKASHAHEHERASVGAPDRAALFVAGLSQHPRAAAREVERRGSSDRRAR
jgi:hypothetical protein